MSSPPTPSRPALDRGLFKFGISVLVLGSALGYLFYASLAGNIEYFKEVDEVVGEREKWIDRPLRVSGRVKSGSIFHKVGTHDYVFTVTHEGVDLTVRYSGIVPDSFVEEAEVVVSGRLLSTGYFRADRVFARCPSKYEAAETQAPGYGAHPADIDRPRRENSDSAR